MQISVAQRRDVSILRVEQAKLTYPALTSFLAQTQRVIAGGARKLVIGLGQVTFIDSPAIGCVMDIHRLIRERSGLLRLCGVHRRQEAMLKMAGVHTAVAIHATESEALRAFGAADDDGGVDPAQVRSSLQ
jgi:anti-anti-sigma factor